MLRQRLELQHLAQSGTGPLYRRLALLAWQGSDGYLRAALSSAEQTWLEQIQALTVEIDERVATAIREPNQGPSLLKGLWDELAKRAGPVANIYGRPKLVEAANGK